MRITLPLRLWRYSLFWMPNRHKDKPLGERLRLALQELGPVWIKFGQMLSTRRDLFPPHIADQLALLQDRVAPFDGLRAKNKSKRPWAGCPSRNGLMILKSPAGICVCCSGSHCAIEIEWQRGSDQSYSPGHTAGHQSGFKTDLPHGSLGSSSAARWASPATNRSRP